MTDETKKEPTTAELFATTRDGIHGRILDITADEAVSELERRMGAMEGVIKREADGLERAGLTEFAARFRAAPPLEESRAFIERAAKLAEAAGAVDIAGALLLLAEVVTTRADKS